MRVVFLGTPDFAELPLVKISENYEVVGVVTQQDKRQGRKNILTPPPVKERALSLGLPVYQFDKISKEGVETLKSLKPDIMVTCAYGQILTQEIIDIPRLGIYNIHASLLPKYRGASPIQSAIKMGEKETGVTIMKTDIGLDTGDILLQERIEIGQNETAGELFERLSVLGADAIVKALKIIESGNFTLVKQDDSKASYFSTLKKQDGVIDFNKNSSEIHAFVRAMSPWPSAYAFLNGETFKLFSPKIVENLSGVPGEILVADKNGLVVATKDSAILFDEIQAPTQKRMSVKDYLLGHKLSVGDLFKGLE